MADHLTVTADLQPLSEGLPPLGENVLTWDGRHFEIAELMSNGQWLGGDGACHPTHWGRLIEEVSHEQNQNRSCDPPSKQ